MTCSPARAVRHLAAALCLLGGVGPLSAGAAVETGAAATSTTASAGADLIEAGRRIYADGVLPSGAQLSAARAGGRILTGPQAACISCHRASGMGSVEGNLRVPAINGRYLFPADGDLLMANTDGIRGKTLNQRHAPYTADTLTRALREGLDVTGRPMSEVMPRYTFDAAARTALMAYLTQLSSHYSPGVTKETIRFATVITPEVAPERRKVFADMMRAALVAKNSSTAPRKRYMTTAAIFVSQSERRWDVETWELTGAPETWNAQLDEKYQRAPVFALLSGLSDTTWAPVHQFCQRQGVPCWFPSVKAPPTDDARYGLYFSRGVSLEGEVLASHLRNEPGDHSKRIIEVYAADSAGQVGARSLRQAQEHAARGGMSIVEERLLGADPQRALRAALQAAHPGDVLALWLSAGELGLLDGLQPPEGVQIYLSGSLSTPASRAALPAVWKDRVHLVYPYQLPDRRAANLAYLHSWLKLQGIALVDEELQSEVFFSLNLMTDSLQDMLDNLYRDYLVERTEDMLGKRETSKAEQENRDRHTINRIARASVVAEMAEDPDSGKRRGSDRSVSSALTPQSAQRRAFGVGESDGTTVYPRLSLGPGQRFASKGAFIVKFASVHSDELLAETDWIVP